MQIVIVNIQVEYNAAVKNILTFLLKQFKLKQNTNVRFQLFTRQNW